MPNTVINGVDLYYEIHGKGMPLMLVAGLASDSQSWKPIIGDLSRHYLVITTDNRGVGRTKPQNIGISIQQIADDCIALIRHLGSSSVNLLGHSMGGLFGPGPRHTLPCLCQQADPCRNIGLELQAKRCSLFQLGLILGIRNGLRAVVPKHLLLDILRAFL